MVLYATDSSTGDAVVVFATNNKLDVNGAGGGGGGVSKTNGTLATTVAGNSISSDAITCTGKNNIRIYGSSNTDKLLNLSFSNDNSTYKNVDVSLNKIVINAVNTFSIELTNIPDYIKFYNPNTSADTLDIYYVLF